MAVARDREERFKQAETERATLIKKARALKREGYSNRAIARNLHMPESTVRGLLKEKTD